MEREIFEQLRQYDRQLYNATYGSFVRLTNNNEKADLARLHKEHFGNDGNIMGGCNRCVLNALRNLGKDYFKEKKIVEAEEKQKEQMKLVEYETHKITELVENKAVTKTKKKSSAKKEQK
jgi:hypothetical protein